MRAIPRSGGKAIRDTGSDFPEKMETLLKRRWSKGW
jgi:hypothetical protein